MRRILLFCLVILFAFYGKAQTYTVSAIPYNPAPFDSGTDILLHTDDLFTAPINIGFDFYFFGVPYQSLIVGANGTVCFDTMLAGNFADWQITGPIPMQGVQGIEYASSIMFPLQDIDATNVGYYFNEVLGSPPNRKFVVSYYQVPLYGTPYSIITGYCDSNLTCTGQVILYESTYDIEVYIQNKTMCPSWNGGLAVLGIQNSDTVVYTAPGRNATQWADSNEAWRFHPDSIPQAVQNLNRISGRVFADFDENCLFNGSDYPLPNKPVIFTNDSSGSQFYIYTDVQGYYSQLVDTGSYSFSATNLSDQLFASFCPAAGSFHVYFPNYNDSSDNNLFADTANVYCPDFTGAFWVWSKQGLFEGVISCDTGFINIECSNNGTANDSAILLLTLNDSTTVISSSIPYAFLGNNTYQFVVGSLYPFNSEIFQLTVKFGCDTGGTGYCYQLITNNAYVNNCNAAPDTEYFCSVIDESYDPNTMYVSSKIHSLLGPVRSLQTQNNDILTYIVTFQNTGTAPAENIKLKIALSSRIDTNSLILLNASSSYSWLVLGDTLIVDFIGINLPDSATGHSLSEGYLKFKVSQKSGNLSGDSIIHEAIIYFDQNAPVATNQNIVKIVGPDTLASDISNYYSVDSILLYPNPGHTIIQIQTIESSHLKVTDIMGRIVFDKQLTQLNVSIRLSAYCKRDNLSLSLCA